MGHSTALVHVSNVYNLKLGLSTHVGVSDVAARLQECS